LSFHKLFIILLCLYGSASTMVKWFLEEELTASMYIPPVVILFIVVLHGFLLAGSQTRVWGGPACLNLMSVQLVLSTALWTLAHDTAQRHLLGLLGACGSVDCELEEDAWRVDGRLPLEWALCYQILFVLPLRHAMCASPVCILVYEGVLLAMGDDFDAMGFIALVVPVSLCLCGRAVSLKELQKELGAQATGDQPCSSQQAAAALERLTQPAAKEPQQLEALDLRLAQGAASPPSSVILNYSSSQEAVDLRPHSLSLSLSLTPSSSLHHEGAKAAPELPPAVDLRRGLLQAKRGRASVHAVGVQTSAGQAEPTQDSAAQTEIVWERDGFRCTRCSKPPLAPQEPTSKPTRDPKRSKPDASSMLAAVMSPSKRSRAGLSMRYPHLVETPATVVLSMLMHSCLAWNIKIPKARCCEAHALAAEAVRLLTRSLRKVGCIHKPAPAAVFQCGSCHLCTDDPEEGGECEWCNDGIMRPSPVAALDDLSSSSASDTQVSL